MNKQIILAALLLLSATVAAFAQSLPLPDPAEQRAQTQAQVNQQLQQTQMNNLQTQQSLQQNQMNQQQLFNSMPAPAYQQPHFYAPPAPKPATP